MRRSFRGKNHNQNEIKEFKVNERINSPELVVIDENGVNLGILTRLQALEEARSRELDLIEVSPKAVPPIAKFMDYGSYKYQKEKSERKQKAKTKTISVKTIKISTRISQHDVDVRVKQALGFLEDGDKVRIELQLRGRENQHGDLAEQSIKRTMEEIKEKLGNKILKIEQDINRQGGKFSATISL